jgi:hypothetical protein
MGIGKRKKGIAKAIPLHKDTHFTVYRPPPAVITASRGNACERTPAGQKLHNP